MGSNHSFSPAQLLELTKTDIKNPISPTDFAAVLSSPVFLNVRGTFNTRDLGQVPGSPIRAGYAFRTASLEKLDDEGGNIMAQKLGIRKIFDLRSYTEREASPEPNVPGIDMTWVPNDYTNAYDLQDFVSGGGEEGYCKIYMSILKVYRDTFRTVLEHVRDRPSEPLLFHCTFGRDRTGILAAILMFLAGADDQTIALDYMLTRIGSEPVRRVLIDRALRNDPIEGGLDSPIFHNMCSLRLTTWELFMRRVESTYGGFEGYIIGELGLDKGDLEIIQKNLRR